MNLTPKLPELPEEGVVSCFGEETFFRLLLLCHSVRETYPVPVACFDTGLSTGQRTWIAENLPSCTVHELPEAAARIADELSRTSLIAASPFRRTCWVDPDLIVLGGLGEVFTSLDSGPVLVSDASLSGWDVERDAALYELTRPLTALQHRALRGAAWTIASAAVDRLPAACFHDADELLRELRRTCPDACVVRLGGEWLETDSFVRSIAARTPGRTRQRSHGLRPVTRLMSMIGAKSSPALVEAFLEHYYRLGVESFLIALHAEPGDSRSERIVQIIRRYETEPVLVTPTFSAARKLAFYAQTTAERCSPQDWVIYADVDELQVFPTRLAEVLDSCDGRGHVFVRGEFVDRLAESGALVEIEPGSPIWEQFPLTAEVTRRLTTGWTGKVCAAKGWLRLGEGGAHTLDYGSDDPRNYIRTWRDPRAYPHTIEVHHFKWDAALPRRTYEKIHAIGGDLDSVDGPGFIPEYQALLEHLERFDHMAIDSAAFAGTPELHYVRDGLATPRRSAGADERDNPSAPASSARAPESVGATSLHRRVPVRSYLICASPRTGSNLLCQLLSQTGVAGFPGEYFYPDGEELNCGWWGIEPGRAYLEEVARRSTSENGVIGTKVMSRDLGTLVERLRDFADASGASDLETLACLLPEPRFILLWREDRIAQAVSWAKALQTGEWLEGQEPEREPVFDYGQIRGRVELTSAALDWWERWVERHQIVPFRISYEELVADMSGSIERILEFLEIPVPPNLRVGDALTSGKQRDEVNLEWTSRYKELEAAGRSAHTVERLPVTRPADAGTVRACTVITRNRLAHARVLARSFLEHHPEGSITALVVDDVDQEVDPEAELFQIVRSEDLLDRREFHRMATMYTAYELAGALKPWIVERLLRTTKDAVVYLDSDVLVLGSLADVAKLAEEHSLVLTPHLTEATPLAMSKEAVVLNSGIFNTGVLAAGPGGRAFVEWWRERLARDCVLAPGTGFWTDQRWVDLAPGYFRHHVLRDPGVNVAPWNLPTRRIEQIEGVYHVNGKPLRIVHFAKFDPHAPHRLGSFSSTVRLSDHPAMAVLSRLYAASLLESGYDHCVRIPYAFDALSNGMMIDPIMRSVYREEQIAAERGTGTEPPNPFTDGPELFVAWLNQRRAPGRASRYLKAATEADVSEEDIPAELIPPDEPDDVWPAEAGALPEGVNLILRIGRYSALDEIGRRMAAALAAAQIPSVTVHWNDGAVEESAFLGIHPETAPFATNLVCLNPVDLGSLAFHVTPEFFARRYTIAMWLDEEVQVPDLQHPLRFVDEVWVSSDFAAERIARETEKPVRVAPFPVEAPVPVAQRPELSLPEGLLYLCLADLGVTFRESRADETNPVAAVRAFTRAFARGEGPTLLVRTTNGDENVVELERLRLETDRADVLVRDGPLSPEERRALVAASDCIVSLHRVEEFGISLAEAMAAGHAVVATGFSGNLAFMQEDNSYLVRFSVGEPGQLGTFYRDAVWAEPDLDHAAELLRMVHDDPAERAQRSARAQAAVLEHLSISASGAFVRNRLVELRESAEPEPAQANVPVPAAPTALQRATTYLASGPSNSWDAPSRFGGLGKLARGLVRRTVRPYATRHRELDSAVVETLAELNHRLGTIENLLLERSDAAERPPTLP